MGEVGPRPGVGCDRAIQILQKFEKKEYRSLTLASCLGADVEAIWLVYTPLRFATDLSRKARGIVRYLCAEF